MPQKKKAADAKYHEEQTKLHPELYGMDPFGHDQVWGAIGHDQVWGAMKKADLVKELRKRKMKVSGTKADLIKRLQGSGGASAPTRRRRSSSKNKSKGKRSKKK